MRLALRFWDRLLSLVGWRPLNRRFRRRAAARRRAMRFRRGPQRRRSVIRRQRFDTLEKRVVMNADPVADNDSLAVYEDSAQYGTVHGSDADMDPLTYAVSTGPSNGSLSLDPSGSYLYTPNANYNGTDSFTFTAHDGTTSSTPATISIMVTPVNDAPTAADASEAVDEDGTLNGSVSTGDIDGDSLTYSTTSGPSNGTVTWGYGGAYTYVPAPNYHGADSFTYQVSDGNGGTASGTVGITVNSVNDVPQFYGSDGNPSFTTAEDTPFSAQLVVPTDPDGPTYYFETNDAPLHGMLVLGSGGYFTYTPAENYHGVDSFSYKVLDAAGGQVIGTGSITIVAVSDVPTFVAGGDKAVDAVEDTPLAGELPAVIDVDGDSVTYAKYQDPAHGTVTVNSNGTFTYTPEADFNGVDSFTYSATDGSYTIGGVVTITVAAVNDAPRFTAPDYGNGVYFVAEDTLLSNALPGANDPEGSSFTYSKVSDPQYGTLTIEANGSFTYMPAAHHHGIVTFSYEVTDGTNGAIGGGTITIYSVNDNPTLPSSGLLELSVNEDESLGGSLSATDVDGDPLTYALAATPTYGTATISSGGSLTYQPNADFFGTDTFTYTVSDGNGGTVTGTVNITINPINDLPATNGPLTMSTDEDAAGYYTPDDTDVESQPLTFAVVSGSATWNGSQFVYTPATNFNGTDTFSYVVNDGNGGTAQRTVTVTVAPVNDAPTAENVAAGGNEDSEISVTPAAADVDGEVLTYSVTTGPANGSVSWNGTSFIYTPNANFNGTDGFTYQVTDPSGAAATAVATVTIGSVNDAPVISSHSWNADENETFATGATNKLTTAVTDVEEDALTFTAGAFATAHGSVTISADGSFTYTPVTDFVGTDSFEYTVSDPNGGTATGTATVQVLQNVVPAPQPDTFAVEIDTPVTFTAAQLLANDLDGDQDVLSFVEIVDEPAHGTLTTNLDGSFTYTPNSGYIGLDSFHYQVADESDPAVGIVYILVGPLVTTTLGTTPLVLDEDGALALKVTRDRIDEFAVATFRFSTNHGTFNRVGTPLDATTNVTYADAADSSGITFVPNPDFNGTAVITITAGTIVSGVFQALVTKTVELTVNPVNDAPTTAGLAVSGDEDQTIGGTVTATDVEGDLLTYSLVTNSANGFVTLGTDGSFTFAPNADFHGSDSFTYRATDPSGAFVEGTVTITVAAVNDAPTASDQMLAVDEDTPLGIYPTASDVDGDPLTYTVSSGPTNGTITFDGSGFTYTPSENYYGSDSVTFSISDGQGGSTSQTFLISINAVNDPPTFLYGGDGSGAYTMLEDTVLNDQLPGASDVESGSVTYAAVSGPAYGTLVLDSGGSFTYTPNANYHGPDSFTYAISDGTGATTGATGTITILSVNDLPSLGTIDLTTDEDTPINGGFSAVDVDGDALTYTLTSSPSLGVVTLSGSSFTYTPHPDANGYDSFNYEVSDGNGGVISGTVNLTITPVNDVPRFTDGSGLGVYTVLEDTALNGQLPPATDPEASWVTYSAVTAPAHGTLAVNSDGSFTYTPDANYHGYDSFTYSVTDQNGGSDGGTGTIEIYSVNDTPTLVAGMQYLSTDEDVALNGTFSAEDVDGDTLTYLITATPTLGIVTVSGDSFTYTPNANANGTDSFTYQVLDGNGGIIAGTINITVNAVNDLPQFDNGTGIGVYTVEEDTTLSGQLPAANDPESSVTYSALLGPAHGTLVVNSDGSFMYTPEANYNGYDSFTYRVSDGTGGSNDGTGTIEIYPANDPPAAGTINISTDEETAVGGTLSATDVDGDSLTFELGTAPAHGTAVIYGSGFTYTPAADFNGTDTFTYIVNDGHGGSITGTVNVTVNPVNDAPTVTLPNTLAAVEQTPLPLHGTGIVIRDVDAESADVLVTLSVVAGKLTATAGSTGVTISGSNSSAITLTGSVAAINELLAGNGEATLIYLIDEDVPPASETLTVVVNDQGNAGAGGVLTATASAIFGITAVNDAPIVVNDAYLMNSNTTLTTTVGEGTSVSANDSDLEEDALTFEIVGEPTHGTISFATDGSFTYTPTSGYHGEDLFTYRALDGQGGSTIGTASISVHLPVLQITATGGGTVSEAATSASIGITLLDVAGAPMVATHEIRLAYYTLSAGAAAGVDFVPQVGTVVIAAGQSSATVTIPLIDNDADQANRGFIVRFTNPVGAELPSTAVGGHADVPVTILDDDVTPTVSLVGPTDMVVEGDQVILEIRLSEPSLRTVSVNWYTQNESANAGGGVPDYVAAGGSLEFLPGETVKSIIVRTLDDIWGERDESFKVVLSDPTNAQFYGTTDQATIVIGANDKPTVSIADAEGTEATYPFGTTTTEFPIVLSNPAEYAIHVAVSTPGIFGGMPDTAENFFDYSLVTLSGIDFAAGETEKTAEVLNYADGTIEFPETYSLQIIVSGADATTPRSIARGTIQDPQSPPLEISVESKEISENHTGDVEIQVSRTAAVATDLTLKVYRKSADGKSATIVGEETFSFSESDPNTKTVNVPIELADDSKPELNEILLIEVTGGPIQGVLVAYGTLTIVDDDQPTVRIADAKDVVNYYYEPFTPTDQYYDYLAWWETRTYDQVDNLGIWFDSNSGVYHYDPLHGANPAPYSIGFDLNEFIEDNPGGPIPDSREFAPALPPIPGRAFKVYLDHPSSKPITVTLTADEGMTFAANDSSTLEITFAAGETEKSVGVQFALTENDTEYLTVSGESSDAMVSGSGTVKVVNKMIAHSAPTYVTDYNYNESWWAEYDTVLSYGDPAFGGQAGDPSYLLHEYYSIMVTRMYEVVSYDPDFDEVERPTVEIADTGVNEKAGTVTLTIALGDPPFTDHGPIEVEWTTESATADAGDDFTAASGTVTFEWTGYSYETTKTISIDITDDDLEEGDEAFRVRLTVGDDVVATDPVALVKILDPIRVSVSDVTVREEGSPTTGGAKFAEVEVALSRVADRSFVIKYVLQGDTALIDADFTYPEEGEVHSITIAEGQRTAIIRIPIVGDYVIESEEQFKVELQDDDGGMTVEGTPIPSYRAFEIIRRVGTVTVKDDDKPTVTISAAAAWESEGFIRFKVTLDQAPTATTSSFHWKAEELGQGTGFAKSGADTRPDENDGTDFISGQQGDIVFAAGETEKYFDVKIVDDENVDQHWEEKLKISLSSANELRLQSTQLEGTIWDDDNNNSQGVDERDQDPCEQCACAGMCQRGAIEKIDPVTGKMTQTLKLGSIGNMSINLVNQGEQGFNQPIAQDYGLADLPPIIGDQKIVASTEWDDPTRRGTGSGAQSELNLSSAESYLRVVITAAGVVTTNSTIEAGIYNYTTSLQVQDAAGNPIEGTTQEFKGRQVVVPIGLPGIGDGWSIQEVDRVFIPKTQPGDEPQPGAPPRELIFATGVGTNAIYNLIGSTAQSEVKAYRTAGSSAILYDLSTSVTIEGVTIVTLSDDPIPVLGTVPDGTRYVLAKKYGDFELFDADGFLTARIDRNGNTTSFAYEEGSHRLLTITDPLQRTKEFTYEGGLLKYITDESGKQVEFVRDVDGRIETIKDVIRNIKDPGSSATPATPTYQLTYNAQGAITERVDPNGTKSTFNLDANSRVQSVSRTDASGAAVADTVNYGPSAAAIGGTGTPATKAGVNQQAVRQGDEESATTTVETDRFGFTTKATDGAGNVTKIDRDAKGRVTQVMTADPDGDGPQSAQVAYRMEYDGRGNLTKQTYADQTFETWTYDETFDFVLEHIDRAGRRTVNTLDERGNVIETVRYGDSSTGDVVTKFVYTDAGDGSIPRGMLERTSVAVGDGRWAVTSYTFGSSHADPEDPDSIENFGKVTSVSTFYADEFDDGVPTDAQVILYTYDHAGRVVRITEPDPDGEEGSQLAAVTVYVYDDAGNVRSQINVIGELDDEENEETDDLVTSYGYDIRGNVVEAVDPIGRRVVSHYDSLNRLDRQTLVVGELDDEINDETDDLTTTFEYDARGNLIRTVAPDPDGVGVGKAPETQYKYDALDRLTDQIQVVGQRDTTANGETDDLVTKYVYDAQSRVSVATDAMGVETKYYYDDLGRVLRVVVAAGTSEEAVVRYEYEVNGDYTQIDPLGNRTVYQLDGIGRLKSIVAPDPDGPGALTSPTTQFEYDGLGRAIKVIDPLNRETSTAYNAQGQATSITLPDPDKIGATNGPKAAPVTRAEYDAAGRLTDSYDANDNRTHYVYDQLGRTIAVTRVVGALDGVGNTQTDDVTTMYAYDVAGRVTDVTNPDPDAAGARVSTVVHYEYDLLDNMTSVTVAYGTSLAATTVYTYDRLGRLTDVEDPTGRKVHYTYDQLSRLTSQSRVVGDVDSPTNGETDDSIVRYEYDKAGRVLKTIDPLNRETRYTYDTLGRTIETRQVVGAVDGSTGTQDDLVTRAVYDVAGRLIGTIDVLGRTTMNEYDRLGRLTASIDALGNRTTYAYDAASRMVSVFEPATTAGGSAVESRYEYDALDRLVSQTAAYGTADAQQTKFGYDAVGNRISLTDAGDNVTTWHYDALNRADRETILLDDGTRASERTWTYDKLGNTVAYVDRNERLTMYVYDILGRKTDEDWYAAGDTVALHGAAVHSFDYGYDAAGRLETLVDSAGPDYEFQYDELGRLRRTDLSGLTDEQITILQSFDKADQRTKLEAFLNADELDDETATLRNRYTYDPSLGRLQSVTQSSDTTGGLAERVTFGYDVGSRLTSIDRQSANTADPTLATSWTVAVSSRYEYDAVGRLTQLKHSQASTVFENYAWAYDAQHRLMSFSSVAEVLTTYGYDARDQLTSVDRTGTANDESYSYDENGNRIDSSSTLGSTEYETDEYNRLLSDGTYSYEYDDEGNRTSRTEIATGIVASYEWDHRNRLLSVTVRDAEDEILQRAAYGNDAFNHRIAKDVFLADGLGGETLTVAERYLYDGDSVLLDLMPNGAPQTSYLVLGGKVLAKNRSGHDIEWLLTDQLGSTRQVVKSDGSLVASYAYDSYGNLLVGSSDPALTTVLWTGLRYDPETGDYYAWHRYYDPATGRWLTEDWIEDNLNNYYSYVDNSPSNSIDPTGLFSSKYHEEITRNALKTTELSDRSIDNAVFFNVNQDDGWLTNSGNFYEPTNHGTDKPIEDTISVMESRIAQAMAATDPGSVIRRFGEVAHAIQDLYAHTNYVEVANGGQHNIGKTIPIWQMIDGQGKPLVPKNVMNCNYVWPRDNAPDRPHATFNLDTPKSPASKIKNGSGITMHELAKDVAERHTREVWERIWSGLTEETRRKFYTDAWEGSGKSFAIPEAFKKR